MPGFDINTVTVSGNLTRDPELRNLPNGGTSVCSLRIAHNDRYKDSGGEWRDRANYFDVTIWGGLGEWMANNLSKGQKVVVSGRLKWREWETQGGDKRQAVDITADSVVPVVRSEGGGGGFTQRSDVNSGGAYAGTTATGGNYAQPNPGQQSPLASGPPDDDIPF